jgi:23S rRNA pseudouridine1911/1915/1917 synthase
MGFAMLEILYDNGPCLVINKPAGILTQAPAGIDSLEVQVKAFYREREQKEGNIYLGLPHRLDRPVSGAIVFARHVRAAQRLSTQFENRTVTKVYWALVEGDVEGDEGTWTDHLHKRHGMTTSIVVPADDSRGKIAVMRYRVRGRGHIAEPSRLGALGERPDKEEPGPEGRAKYTWLEIELETGRTHQIRVQCASRGHAVIGDAQYGSTRTFGEQFEDERLRAIALHARQLGFNHPMTREAVDVIAPLPKAWAEFDLPLRE